MNIRNKLGPRLNEWVGIVLNNLLCLSAAWASYPFLNVPVGTEGRPMGWAAFIMLITLLAVSIGIVTAIPSFQKRRYGWGLLLILMGIVPFIIGHIFLRYAVSTRGFIMLD